MSLIQTIENNLGKNHLNWLEVVQGRYSIPVKVYKPVKNVYNKVYGRDSGEEYSQDYDTIDAIVIGDDFFPQDAASAGGFKEGILFTTSDVVNVGDRIEFKRDDTKSRRYAVESIQKIGSSQSVFRKIRVSALGD